MDLKFNKKVKKAGLLDNRSQKVVNQTKSGAGYTYKSLMGMFSILTTEKFSKDSYYMASADKYKMLTNAIDEVVRVWDAEFAAKVIVYVRTLDGHRTSCHLAAVHMAQYLSGEEYAKFFFSKREKRKKTGGVVYRLDDAMEISAAYLCLKAHSLGRKIDGIKPFKNLMLPNSMVKGFRTVLQNADWYELAKYQKKGALISLVDLINLVHPNRLKSNPRAWRWMEFDEYKENMEQNITTRNKQAVEKRIKAILRTADKVTGKVRIHAFEAAVNGWLRQENTAEDKNSALGQEVAKELKSGKISQAEATTKLVQGKQKNYLELITKGKLGYNALIKQLRAIAKIAADTQDKELTKATCLMIINEKLIRSSLIWPGQLELAYEILTREVVDNSAGVAREFALHIVRAYDSACLNLKELGMFGRSNIVIDSSGSMGSSVYHNDWGNSVIKKDPNGQYGREKSRYQVAGLIGATIAKGVNGDVYQFGNSCRKMPYSIANPAFTIAEKLARNRGQVGHGTSFQSIFNTIDPCERVFIVSDMQNGDRFHSAYQAYKQWMKRNGLSGVYVYLINVNSYGTTAMPDSTDPHIINCAGYSFEMLQQMMRCETNPNALAEEINKINMVPVSFPEIEDPLKS